MCFSKAKLVSAATEILFLFILNLSIPIYPDFSCFKKKGDQQTDSKLKTEYYSHANLVILYLNKSHLQWDNNMGKAQ